MDIVLLVVTALSALAAVILGVTTWRLSREARARSEARIAALAAAANEEAPLSVSPPHPEAPAWAAAHAAPAAPRAAAPVAAPWVARPSAPSAPPRAPAPLGDSFLGGFAAPPPQNTQRRLAVAAGILVVVVLAGGYVALSGGGSSRADQSLTQAETRPPLELVWLRHERRDTRLAITGMIRNPVDAGPVEKLSAVALLFDQQGALLTTARADVDYTRLVPGDESPFVITSEVPPTVARYRVSFRNDGGVVPHIDRREQEPIARQQP